MVKATAAIFWLVVSCVLLPLARAETAPKPEQPGAEEQKERGGSAASQSRTGDKKADGGTEPDCNN